MLDAAFVARLDESLASDDVSRQRRRMKSLEDTTRRRGLRTLGPAEVHAGGGLDRSTLDRLAMSA